MRVLHYFLGFPPYRSGGLTKFVFDLMNEQVKNGDSVGAIWPGKMCFIDIKTIIVRRAPINSIENFEIINPLPVPLDEGIKNVDYFKKNISEKVFDDFLEKYNFEILHIHTLMGLHKEFIDAAIKRKIKTIFTTHDYFGICPKVTLFDGKCVCEKIDFRKCALCNQTGLSINKIRILQSPVYRLLKNNTFIKKIRKKHRDDFEKSKSSNENKSNIIYKNDYKQLQRFYFDILEEIDIIHFNSTVSRDIYLKFINPKKCLIKTISHKDIQDYRNLRVNRSGNMINLLFLSPAKSYKGFDLIISALDELWNEGLKKYKLTVYNYNGPKKPYINAYENGYTMSELKLIFKNHDILLAPSVWFETFGFTVLEALSYGVPVIISSNVGAKDIVNNGGIVIEPTVEELKKKLNELDRERVNQLSIKVIKNSNIKIWKEFIDDLDYIYKS